MRTRVFYVWFILFFCWSQALFKVRHGHQQLVGVARALVIGPKLILADEPTGNLNSDQGREVMTALAKLNEEGTTIVQVTHSEENARYADRIVHLLDGKVEKEEVIP